MLAAMATGVAMYKQTINGASAHAGSRANQRSKPR
jgi:hypothetical protein